MRFIPKVRKHFLLRHYKEMMAVFTAVLMYMIVTTPLNINKPEEKVNQYNLVSDKSGKTYDQNTHEEINALKLLIGTEVIGYASLDSDVYGLLDEVVAQFTANPANAGLVVDKQLTVAPAFLADKAVNNDEQIKSKITGYLLANRDSLKTDAYLVKVGEDFSVYVKNLDDVAQLLQGSQEKYVSDVNYFGVNFDENAESGVLAPVVYKKRISSDSRALRTVAPALNLENSLLADSVDRTLMEKDYLPENTELGVVKSETIGIEFAEEVIVEKAMASSSEIMSPEEATAAVTKENEQPETYAVAQNDTLSGIASEHSMSLADLDQLNPGVSDQKYLNIGQELVVMVPQSELSVNTLEKQVYNVSIERNVTYVEDSNIYVNSSEVRSNGSDGVKQVTAVLHMENGIEVSREIVSEEVILEPIDKVIAKGTKVRPVTAATGNYINPLPSGRVTSSFGPRWGSFHEGIDLAAPTGTPFKAADGGTVTRAGWNGTYGYCIDIDHGNGEVTRYGHCSVMLVGVGDKVAQGEVIGKVGNTGRSTGPHLHFEIRVNDVAKNPAKYIF